MRFCDFDDIFSFYLEYLCVSSLLDFDPIASRGSHAFSIYKAKMVAKEDLALYVREVTLRDKELLTLKEAVRIVENARPQPPPLLQPR